MYSGSRKILVRPFCHLISVFFSKTVVTLILVLVLCNRHCAIFRTVLFLSVLMSTYCYVYVTVQTSIIVPDDCIAELTL